MRIGVDVGGTNTDAVLLNGSAIIAAVKTPTTSDIQSGVIEAINSVIGDSGISADSIDAVMIGTTQFTNAFVEARGLLKVGVLRLGAPATESLPPMTAWPDRLKDAVFGDARIVAGGNQIDGSPIQPLDEQEIRSVARRFREQELRAVAISSVFAPLKSDDEHRAAEIVASELPNAAITLSSEIGRIGLLERESAAIMNSCLAELSRKVVNAFVVALQALGIESPLYITQNDGTLMQARTVERFPVLTFASGPTNSMRGAAFLTAKSNAVIVDIGGTTSDVGVLVNGFPRESSINVDIGGIRTNFRIPDIFSLGLGGGSLVRSGESGSVTIGPESVGHEINDRALIFGGDTLTATDVAVAAGRAEIGDPVHLRHLSSEFVQKSVTQFSSMIEDAVDRMKTSSGGVSVVLVGGGAVLAGSTIAGATEVIVPENHGVANAVGAAIAQVGGEIDRIVSFEQQGREQAIAALKDEAIDRAEKAGAVRSSINVIDVDEIPLAYVPGHAVRVRVKAVGDLPLQGAA